MKKSGKTILIENRKARFDYEEFDTFEAGIILA
jgi:tmRNA-binding protein